MNRSKKIGLLSLLVAASLTVSLILCEFAARLVIDVQAARHVGDGETHWNVDHPTRVYALTPGYRGRLVAGEFDHRVEINSFGLRGPEPDRKLPGVFLLGDSFAFGAGVDFDQTLGARLQGHLKVQRGRDVQVWNLGVPSYAFPRYRLMLEEYLAHCVPEAVVVCAYYGTLDSGANDLLGALTFHGGASRENVQKRKPALTRFQAIKNWLSRNSMLYAYLGSTVWVQIRGQVDRPKDPGSDLQRRLEKGWGVFNVELARIKVLSVKHGFEVVVVSIPVLADLADPPEDMVRQFGALVEKHQVRSFDGMAALTPDDGRALYYPHDGHLNAKGYDFFAARIADSLSR